MKQVNYKINIDTGSSNANIKKTDASVKNLGKDIDKVSVKGKKGMDGLGNSFAMMPGGIGRVVQSLKMLKIALLSSGIGAIVVAAGALVGLFAAATKKGAEFAKQMSTLKAISGSTDEQMQKLSASAKELGATTSFTAIEVGKLQTEYAKLGFSTDQILATTKATLDLATALDTDLASAATLTGSTINSFGLKASDSQRVVDVLAKSAASSALDFGYLTESLKLAAPMAKATNRSLEETVAMLGKLHDAGLKGSIAGTGLAKTFVMLNKKGMSLKDAYSEVAKSSDKLGTAVDLVGVIGAKSLLNLASKAEGIDELTVSLENAEGAAAVMAATRFDNLEGDTIKLSSAWEGFLLSLEDGEGVFNFIARSLVQYWTLVIQTITKVSTYLGAFFAELGASFEPINRFKLHIKEALQTIRLGFLKVKETIAEIPFIGKMIDKKSLQESIKNVKASLKQIDKDQKYWADKAAKRQKEGTLLERTANRIKENEIKITNAKIEKEEQKLAEERKKLTEEQIKAEKKRLATIEKFREKILKKQQDLEDTTEEQKLARQKERDLKALDKLKTTTKEKGELTLAINKLYDDKLIALKKKQNDKLLKEEQKRLDKEKELKNQNLQTIEDLENAFLDSKLSKEQQEINAVYDKYFAKIEAAKQYGLDIALLEEGQQAEITAIEKKYAKERIATETEVQQKKLTMTNDALGAIGELITAFAGQSEEAQKRAFNLSKAVSLAQAIVSTAQGIIGVMADPKAIASGTSFIQAGIVAATGAAQVATILRTKFEGGASGSAPSSPSAPSGTGIESQAPAFNVVGQSGFNQVAQALGQQPPVQAYVVSGNVTTAQALDNNIIETATF